MLPLKMKTTWKLARVSDDVKRDDTKSFIDQKYQANEREKRQTKRQ